MIDDMVVNLGSGGSFDYEVRLLYPASTVLPVAVVSGTDFVLNDSNSTRNMWFRVPAWTKLEILVTGSFSTGSLRLGVIGRG